MKKILFAFVPWSLILATVFVGCQGPEKTARDAIAGAHGFVVMAEQQHPECSPNLHPGNQGQPACQVIAKSLAAQNVAIDALETYCQITPADPPTKPCAPVKDALPALNAAVANLNQATADIRNLVTGK